MFKEDIKTVFPLLKELYDLDGLILVGSDVTLWKELSEQTNITDIHYVNTQEQKQISFPNEWHLHEQLLAKDDGIVSYYDLSNFQLSGTIPSEALRTLWRNLKTVDVREKKALTLETFMSNVSTRKNALVVNSFDAVDIVQKSAGVEVVIAATIDSDDESLTHYSKNALDAQMKKLGYKAVALLEDKHPQVFLAVYALDKEKQKEELETLNAALQTKTQESEKLVQEQAALKEEKQKVAQAFETEKANTETLQKEKEELNKALQSKNSEVETLKNELKTKTQESEKLVKEQAALKEEKQKVAQTLEAEKANAATLQKEKEELNKTLQSKNNEVETLNNELKTKTETLTKSLEQEKQNSTKLKKELEILNAALQTKTQESEKLAKEQAALKEEKQKVVEALEAEKANAAKLQNELKTKTEALTKSLEQEKQNTVNLKKELETLNAALQAKTQEDEKLAQEQAVLKEEKKKMAQALETEKKKATAVQKEYETSQFILKQMPKKTSLKEAKLIALAENAQVTQKYKETIGYWQQLASLMSDEMPQIYYKRLAQAYKQVGGFPLATDEEEALKGSMDKHEFLSKMHESLKPELYLEIGVQTGKSLVLSKCNSIGIDPMPMINQKLEVYHNLFTMTSDSFFKTLADEHITESIDLAFIDGMHLFEYALRDFINVEKHSTQETVIVMDDIYPGHPAQAERDRRTRAWTGDIWKLVAILKKYRKDLDIVTLDIYPTGVMIVRNLDKDNTYLQDNYKKIVHKYKNKKINVEKYIERKNAVEPSIFLQTLKKEV